MSERARILIVDDERSMREFLEILFRREGYDVETASEVDAALVALGSLYPRTGLTALNSTAIFHALLRPLDAPLPVWGDVDPDGLRGVVEEIDALIEGTPGDDELPRQVRQAARLARHGAWRLARRSGLPCPDTRALHRDLSDAIAEQGATWSASSRPGGLEDSLARLRRALEDYA